MAYVSSIHTLETEYLYKEITFNNNKTEMFKAKKKRKR